MFLFSGPVHEYSSLCITCLMGQLCMACGLNRVVADHFHVAVFYNIIIIVTVHSSAEMEYDDLLGEDLEGEFSEEEEKRPAPRPTPAPAPKRYGLLRDLMLEVDAGRRGRRTRGPPSCRGRGRGCGPRRPRTVRENVSLPP